MMRLPPFMNQGMPQGFPQRPGMPGMPPGMPFPGMQQFPQQQMPPQGMPPQTFNPMPFEGGLGNGLGYKKPAQNPGLGLGLGRGYFGPPQGMPTKGTRGMY